MIYRLGDHGTILAAGFNNSYPEEKQSMKGYPKDAFFCLAQKATMNSGPHYGFDILYSGRI